MNYRSIDLATLALAGAGLAASALAYPQLPEMVTIHWDIHGNPDAHAPKLIAVLILPVVMLLLPVLHRLTRRAEPRHDNLERSMKAINAVGIAAAAVLLIVHLTILGAAIKMDLGAPRVALLCIGIVLVAAGNYMGKTRSNFTIGVRNRWTLSSERVWDRTHRLAGRLFVAEGLLAVVLSMFAPASAAAAIGLLLIFAATLGLIQAYSYRAWKQEQASL